MFVSLALFLLLSTGKELSRIEGAGMLIFLIGCLWLLIRSARKSANNTQEVEEVDDTLSQVSNFKITMWLLIGGVSLWGGSELLVKGAVDLAVAMGVTERVIAVTMIAVGTSVPELAASVIAALKKEKAISLGNLIGSNIFNIACVLGITSMIQPVAVKSPEVLSNDIFWMLGFAAVLIPLAFLPKKLIMGRYKGLLIVVAYAIFIGMAFIN